MNEGMPGAAASDADIHSQGSTGSGGGVPDLLQSPSTQAMPLGSHSPLVNTVGNQAMGETLEQSPSAVEQPQFGFDSPGASSSDSEDQPERLRSLNDIYQNTSEVELMYDSDGEALMVEMEEPTSHKEAASYAKWTEAMNKEIQLIEKNKTWKLCQLPVGHKPIGLKWVYKLKKNSDGEVTKHKARLVAKGYVQKKGIDFDDVFAPVARLDTVRLLLAMAANRGWQVHHLDVKSAFLHGELEEEVYVSQPEGYVVEGKEQYVLKLSKALYGLRQAPRAWNVRLDRSLKKLKFRKCASEQAVYTRGVGKSAIILGVYVDDLIVTGEDPAEIKEFKEQMTKEFEMSDLGLLSYYLGIEVGQYRDFTIVKQTGYAKKVLDQFGMGKCNATKFPMDPGTKLHSDKGGHPVNATEYRRVIGSLRYLLHTRPDLAYSVGIASRFMEKPTMMHMNAIKQILRYLKGTVELGLVYTQGGSEELLMGYSDSDVGGDLVGRRSTAGMAFYLGESLITWCSQKQKTVALSSCEAEFMAATYAAMQALWLRSLMAEITAKEPKVVTLYVDNNSAIALMKNLVFYGRSKHIDSKYHFIRECVERGQVAVRRVCTVEQKADALTKPLPAGKLAVMRHLLGVRDLSGLQD